MLSSVSRDEAISGVWDHWGWAVLVTATADGTLLDRRRVELVDGGLPKFPHHDEAQRLPLAEAVDLIERVRASAGRHAGLALNAVATAVSRRILGVAIRQCPPLPAGIAERLTDYRSQNVADSVLYRNALAVAAEARGWAVHWYVAQRVLAEARAAFGGAALDDHLVQAPKSVGPPWGKDHRLAMAAAIVAAKAS
jgi:hypothetical protein